MIGTKPIADEYLFLTRNITISKLITKSRIFVLLQKSVEKNPGILTREKKLSGEKDLEKFDAEQNIASSLFRFFQLKTPLRKALKVE